MEFIRKNTLLNKLIIVDGIGKCGKSLLCDVITCYEQVEKQEFNSFLEFIALAYKYKKISPDIAKAILQTEMDTALYNNMIGRYINTRLTDATSLYAYHSPDKYLKRALGHEGSIINEDVLRENPIYLCWSHDLINKSDIVFETFGDKLIFIFANRRPIDIIYEWNKAGYSNRMSKDATEMQYCVSYQNTVIPEIAIGWEEEYLNSSPLEQTVKIIYSCLKHDRDALYRKKDLSNLYIFNFEDLVTEPFQMVEKLKKIIGNDILPCINHVLHKHNCPRKLNVQETQAREKYIKENVSTSFAKLLPEMDAMYEEIKILSQELELVLN